MSRRYWGSIIADGGVEEVAKAAQRDLEQSDFCDLLANMVMMAFFRPNLSGGGYGNGGTACFLTLFSTSSFGARAWQSYILQYSSHL